ncbi:hypothetical protein SAMN05192533_10569 [Mesobacillus persicus]|uniref:Uncharacterized protein n=1 Tax=Mesobacillus persicus TaxID=930146 RepID=A0A1H8ALI3_9BACI|nr:hypothetical protein SAMN05192533_10569 [Mesobacillus persicus]
MPKYTVKLRKPAAKYYEKLPPKLKHKVKEVIEQLRENPFAIANVIIKTRIVKKLVLRCINQKHPSMIDKLTKSDSSQYP